MVSNVEITKREKKKLAGIYKPNFFKKNMYIKIIIYKYLIIYI